MLKSHKWIAMAVVVALGGCQTAPPPKMAASSVPAPASGEVPYHWTVGNAPQAHKDMVAAFGKVGLKPGEYVWTTTVPATGDTRIVADLLTQMVYVYRGDKLVGASSMSSAKTGHITPYGYRSILEKRPFTVRRSMTTRPCRSCNASTSTASPSTAASTPAIRRATAACGCR